MGEKYHKPQREEKTKGNSKKLTPTHTDSVLGLELIDVDVLASVSADNAIILWNLTTLLSLKTLKEHADTVFAVRNVDVLNEGNVNF